MPPRTFPFPLRVGTDLCHIPRVRALLEKNIGKKAKDNARPLSQFLSRLLTWPERQYFWGRFKDSESAYANIDKVAQFLAGRWAAKEACRKACPWLKSSNGFHNIMILPIHVSKTMPSRSSMAPAGLILHRAIPSRRVGSAPSQDEWEERVDFDINTVEGQLCEVSISHDFELATAVAIVPYTGDEN